MLTYVALLKATPRNATRGRRFTKEELDSVTRKISYDHYVENYREKETETEKQTNIERHYISAV